MFIITIPTVKPSGRGRLVAALVGALWLLPMAAANAVEPADVFADVLVAQEPASDLELSELSDADQERVNEALKTAQQHVDNENYSAAIAVYQDALTIDRNNARLYSGIGYLQILKGDFQLAVESYQIGRASCRERV